MEDFLKSIFFNWKLLRQHLIWNSSAFYLQNDNDSMTARYNRFSWSFKSLASMARVGRMGGLLYILIKIIRYVISKNQYKITFFLISLFLKNELDPQVSNEGFRGWPMLTRMPGRLEDKHREFERNTTSVSSSMFAFKFLLHPLLPL